MHPTRSSIVVVDDVGFDEAAVARESVVDSGTVSRFMRAERSITLDLTDRIGQVLKLRIVCGRRR